MIEPVFDYDLSDAKLKKLGELMLTWSHTEQLIGNCLKAILKLSDTEATAIVFVWTLEQRLQKLYALDDSRTNEEAKHFIAELKVVMPSIQKIRNNVIHAVLVNGPDGLPEFRRHSKNRNLEKEAIFSA